MRALLPSPRSIRPVALSVAAALSLLSLPAHATINEVTYVLESDGTPGWDPVAGPGFDTGPKNQIVRTHDAFHYAVTLATTGTNTQVRIQLTLPTHEGKPIADWTYAPTACTGSAISKDGQTLTCTINTLNGTLTPSFGATVRSSAPHGARIPAPAMRVVSDQSPAGVAPVSLPPDLSISAAPFYDIVIQQSFPGNPQTSHGFSAGSGPNGEAGFYHKPLIGVVARNPNGNGKKGVEQLDPRQPVTVELDVSGYPASVRVNDWNRRATNIGTFADGCGSAEAWQRPGQPSVSAGDWFNMASRVSDNGPAAPQAGLLTQTVANGGDCSVAGADRNRVSIRIDGMDTTLAHTPTTFRGGTPIPATDFWVANKGLVLWTLASDYPANGAEVAHPLSLASFSGVSVSGQPMQDVRQDNNAYSRNLKHVVGGAGGKTFRPDNSKDAPYATSRDPDVVGDTHANYMAPGQTVMSALGYGNRGTSDATNVVLCEIIDRTAFDIGENFSVRPYAGGGAGAAIVPTVRYGARASGSPHFDSTDAATDPRTETDAGAPVGTSDYSRASCDDPGIRWFDTREAAEAAGGLVYVRTDVPRLEGGRSYNVDIRGLILRPTWGGTIAVQRPAAGIRQAGELIPSGTILRNIGHIYSDQTPELRARRYRDHLQVVQARTLSRISKRVTAPDNAVAGNPVPAGTLLTYRLEATHSTEFPPLPATVVITDILPAGISYEAGSSTVGDRAVEPTEIRENTPASGQTTLVWHLPDRLPFVGAATADGAKLPVIEFRARLALTLHDGEVLRNIASISGGRHDADPDCVYDAGTQGFGTCPKASEVRVSTRTPPGFSLDKRTPSPTIEAGEDLVFTISATPIGQDLRAPNIPDHIDILPFNGDGVANARLHFGGRNPASRFLPGTTWLKQVSPPANDPTARVYYTSHPPAEINNDPRDTSNTIPGGSTRWCLEAELGTPGCPASIANSTAFRVTPGIEVLNRGHSYTVAMTLGTDELLARKGDIIANRAGVRPHNPSSSLLYLESASDVHVRIGGNYSGISGRVFSDIGADGQRDARDRLLASQCVVLTGTTDRGQPVSYSMRTSDAGEYGFVPGATQPVYPGADCTGTAIVDFPGLLAGTYAVSMTGELANHADGKPLPGSAGGTAGTNTITGITLDRDGVNATDYDFTRVPNRARITLQDSVTNRHGGTLSAGTVVLAADADSTQTQSGEAVHLAAGEGRGSIRQVPVPAGTFALNHAHIDGYRTSAWACQVNGQTVTLGGQRLNTLSLDWGDEAVCTIVHEDLPATLTLNKLLNIVHGRSASVRDFELSATPVDAAGAKIDNDPARPVISGRDGDADITRATVLPGRFQLAEAGLPFFTGSAWRCTITRSGGNSGSATLEPGNILSLGVGEAASCAITNSDEPFTFSLVSVDTGGAVEDRTSGRVSGSASAIAEAASLPPVGMSIRRIVAGQTADTVPVPDDGSALTNVSLGREFLVRDGEYEYVVTQTAGYITRAICHDRDNNVVPARFVLSGDRGGISCRAQRTRKATVLENVEKTTAGTNPVAGTTNEYEIAYTITVKNGNDTAGAAGGSSDGHYDLQDIPGFDPDVEVLDQRIVFHDGERQNTISPVQENGQWQLARHQAIAMGATHTYTLNFRLRVPHGSNEANDSCAAVAGRGLFNQVRWRTRDDVTDALLNGTLPAETTAGDYAQPRSACAPTPVPQSSSSLAIEKTASTRSAEVGDLVTYRLRIRNLGNGPALSPVVVDRLPHGFRIEPGSVRVQNARQTGFSQNGRVVQFSLDRIEAASTTSGTPASTAGNPATGAASTSADIRNTANPGSGEVLITYRVRLGVGSQEGDGINRAHVECPLPHRANAREQCSNESRWKIEVTDGVFTEEACIAGQIFVDCNGNSVKDNEELGIPGVRMYLQNGTWLVSDEQGKYSYCGLRPRTHVLKVDGRTLPRRARLITSSAQNTGDAHSLFIDAKKGMLHRADFIEGSCSATVIEQVKARQQQGPVGSVQTEAGQPALRFDSKKGHNARPRQQGTDPAQPAARTRH